MKFKIKFKYPKKKNIIIFYPSPLLMQMILFDKKEQTTIVDPEEPTFYPGAFFRYIRIFVKNILNEKHTGENFFKVFRSCFYRALIFVQLQVYSPKIIITGTDDSGIFHWICQRFTQAKCYAIQNGNRVPVGLRAITIFLDNYFCYGDYEQDLYKKFNQKIRKYIPVGSLASAYYHQLRGSINVDFEYDVCLVSQWKLSIFVKNEAPIIKDSIEKMNAFIARYFKARPNLTLGVAGRYLGHEEEEYYNSVFSKNYTYVKYTENFSTYEAMSKSRLVTAFFSTAAREAFGWNKKVLFIDFSNTDYFHDYREGLWLCRNENYIEFERIMDELLAMSDQEYHNQTKDYAQYLMRFNLNKRTDEIIRGFLFSEEGSIL